MERDCVYYKKMPESSGAEYTASMDVGNGGAVEPCPPWIFIHDTDRVEGGLSVLFLGPVFSVVPSGNFSVDALDRESIKR